MSESKGTGSLPSSFHRWAPLFIYGVTLFGAIVFAMSLYHATLEDAFITFRYARNLAHGSALGNWNPDGPAVEGFTSFAWMLFNAFWIKLGVSPLVAAKNSSLLFFALASLLPLTVWLRGRQLERDADIQLSPGAALASAILLAGFAPLGYYATTGMEVSFFVLQTVALLLTPSLLQRTSSRIAWSSSWSALLVLTRPEGILLACLVNAYFVLRRPGVKNRLLSVFTPGLLSALLAYLVLMIVRWNAFHSLLPNTYFAKATGGSSLHRLFLGLHYDAGFAIAAAPMTMLFLAGVAGLLFGRFRRQPFLAFLVGVTLVYLAYITKVGGDPVSAFPLYRQFSHASPLWLFAVGIVLATVLKSTTRISLAALGAVLLTGAFMRVVTGRAEVWQLPHWRTTMARLDPPNPAFLWLDAVSSDRTVAAVTLAGQWPYAVRGNAIDMLGLNDLHIAKFGHLEPNTPVVDSKIDIDYVFAKAPDFLDGYVKASDIQQDRCPDLQGTGRTQMMKEIVEHPGFLKYDFVTNAPYASWNRAIFVRHDYATALSGRITGIPVNQTVLLAPSCLQQLTHPRYGRKPMDLSSLRHASNRSRPQATP